MALGSAAEVQRLLTVLDLKDNFSRGIKTADASLNRFQQSGERIGHGIRQVGSGITTLGIRAGVAAAGGLTAVVKTAIDFESAFAGVAKTVDATGPELEALEQDFINLSKTIPLSVEELEGIGEQAGALGIAKEDILAFTETVAKIGATTDVTSDQAATALGQLSNVLDLTADDFDNFGATLVDLGNKGASTESQILEIASRAGAGASLIGIATDATLGWSSAVANLGVQVEAGGTALQEFFLRSAKNININERLALMAETAGVTGKAFKKAFEEDAGAALQQFLIGLGKMSQGDQLRTLDDLNLKGSRLQRVILGLAGDQKNLADSLDVAGKAWSDNSALNEEFAKRAATTESALKVLVNNLRIAANTIGQELLPVIRDLSAEFVDFLNKPGTQKGIKDFAKGLADGIRDFVKQFRSGQFDGILQSLKDAAGVMKIAFDAFNALPGPLKSALIAGAVVNRATGGALGLITSGLVNIGKGVGGLLSRGGSPATPLFTKEVGLTPGGGGLPVAGGGGLVSVLGRAFGLAAAGVIGFEIGNIIGHELFFNPTVKPAQNFEDTRFERFLNNPAAKSDIRIIQHNLDAVDQGLDDLIGENREGRIIGQFLFGEQIDALERQERILKDLLANAQQAGIGNFVPQNPGGTPGTPAGQGNKLNPTLVSDRLLNETTKLQNEFIRNGNDKNARALQGQIDALHLLRGDNKSSTNRFVAGLGKVHSGLSTASRKLDTGNAIQSRVGSHIDRVRDRLGTGFQSMVGQQQTANAHLGAIERKGTDVNVTVPVTTYVSISDIVRQSATYNVATSYASQLRRGFAP